MTTHDTIYQNRKPNRLANEKSPYILQHVYNPVNWYPWEKKLYLTLLNHLISMAII